MSDPDAPSAISDCLTIKEHIAQDMSLGYSTREIMTRHCLTWQQLRPITELIAPKEVAALRKQRIAQRALETAEDMSEILACSTKQIDPEKLPAAIKTMLDVSQQAAGEAAQVIEHRHTVSITDRNQSLSALRQAARVAAAQQQEDEAIDAEIIILNKLFSTPPESPARVIIA